MRKLHILCWLVAIVFLQASLTRADDKLPVPSEKDQAEAMELVKEVFGNDLNSRDAKVLARVAGDLLKQAGDPNNDAPMRYVLLLKAAETAAEAGDSTLALDAIAKLEEKFRANTGQIELKVLAKMASTARQPEEYAPVAEGYARLAVKALANDDFATANDAARLARTTAQRTRNVQAVQAMNKLQRAVTDAERSFRDVADAMRTLSANPDDPAANEVVGRHLAFTRGDWAAGLPHLVKAADKELVAAAQTDLNDPKETEVQVALGDAWYDVAQKQDNETAKAMVMVRAGTYYKKAMPQLGGMARARVERRVEEVPDVNSTLAMLEVPSFTSPKVAKLEKALGYKLGRRPDDAVEFQGHWYVFYHESIPFQQAYERCKEMGGHLIIINNQEEHDFARRLAVGKSAWIGLLFDSGTWKWVDKSSVIYSNWNRGEPNGGGRYSAHINYKGTTGWNDHSDSEGFICEWVQ